MNAAARGALALAIAVGASCQGAPARALDTVRINYVEAATYYDGIFLAIDHGYFATEGIAAELTQAGGGVATPALIAGDLDFSSSGSVAISAILKGAKLKVLFVTSDRPAFELWARADIHALADLKGQQVGIITRGDTSEITLRYYLAKHGLPADFVSYTPLGTGAQRVALMSSGAFPAGVIGSTEIQQMIAMGKVGSLHRLVDLGAEVRMVFSGLAASDALIAAKPDLVRRTLRAILKGLMLAKASKADAVAAEVRRGADAKGAAGVYDLIAPLLTSTGTIALDDANFELHLRADMLGVPKDQVRPADQVFDFRFVTEAMAELKRDNWQPEP